MRASTSLHDCLHPGLPYSAAISHSMPIRSECCQSQVCAIYLVARLLKYETISTLSHQFQLRLRHDRSACCCVRLRGLIYLRRSAHPNALSANFTSVLRDPA